MDSEMLQALYDILGMVDALDTVISEEDLTEIQNKADEIGEMM